MRAMAQMPAPKDSEQGSGKGLAVQRLVRRWEGHTVNISPSGYVTLRRPSGRSVVSSDITSVVTESVADNT